MDYTCYHCEKQTEAAHTFTVYGKDGVEEKLEVLCPECYSEWLQSLKG